MCSPMVMTHQLSLIILKDLIAEDLSTHGCTLSRLVSLAHLMLSLSPTSIEAHSTPLETLRSTFKARRGTLKVTKTPPLSVGILPSLILPLMHLGPVSLCFAPPDDPRSSFIKP